MKDLKYYINEGARATILHFSCIESAALFYCEYLGQISDGKYENSHPYDHWKWLNNVKMVLDGNEYFEGRYHEIEYTFSDWDKYIERALKGDVDKSWGFTVRTFDIAKLANTLPKSIVLSVIIHDGDGFANVAQAFGKAACEGKSWSDLDVDQIARYTYSGSAKGLINQKNYEAFVKNNYSFDDFVKARQSCEETMNTHEGEY